MPRKKLFAWSERDWPDARKLLEEFRKVGRTLRHPKPVEEKRGQRDVIRLAMTTADHSPNATQTVNLCDADFVEGSDTRNAINDSGVTIPNDTKLYIKRIQGKWRIIQAFICTE